MANVTTSIEAIAQTDLGPVWASSPSAPWVVATTDKHGNLRLQYDTLGYEKVLKDTYAKGKLVRWDGNPGLLAILPDAHLAARAHPVSVWSHLHDLKNQLGGKGEETLGIRNAHEELLEANRVVAREASWFRADVERAVLAEGNPHGFNILSFDNDFNLRAQPHYGSMPVNLGELFEAGQERRVLALSHDTFDKLLGAQSGSLTLATRKATKIGNSVIEAASLATKEVPISLWHRIPLLGKLGSGPLAKAFNHHLRTFFPLLLVGILLAGCGKSSSDETHSNSLADNFLFRSVLGYISPAFDMALTGADVAGLV